MATDGLDSIQEEIGEVPLEIATTASCSQGIPGTVTLEDGSQKNVLVSAGHCLYGIAGEAEETYPEVYAPLPDGRKLIAQREHGDKVYPVSEGGGVDAVIRQFDGPDWSTAEVAHDVEMSRVADSVDQYGRRHGEPVVLTGVRDYRDLGQWEVDFDDFGQPICKDGQTSGRTCGIQLMRTSNGIWHTNLSLSGDSGGVNFDPVTGEALGVTSMGFFGLGGRAQPIDVALEQACGIPDGQVNERFTLPESTQEHSPTYTLEEDTEQTREWVEQNIPEDMFAPEEPLTLEDAHDQAWSNLEAGVGEARIQTQDTMNRLSEDPTQVDTVVNNAVETAEYVGGLVEETAQAYGSAFENLLAEEGKEEE
ncbi:MULTISPECIES: hypothetical protein [unclassified Corynebacterium]|uniref:hypothetical protein n=1 Tax=unclassified Corynebacterium TaxID=2624378 RepID=UPI0029C9E91D|nr:MULTISPECIES: hypothetical protein [unclassified Corynebacterium]WPF65303.1 hypothetical protein OLX12_06860 [Corynebacterium sp. 22KM0430]WPF67798.1 hypothetical protein OLW90_06850 [Corynebacterium sp. 21KM1197]